MTKKMIREGEGDDSYTDTEKMKFSGDSVNDDAGSLAGFAPNDLEFKAGDDEVCDAVDCAVMEKKKGEKAVIHGYSGLHRHRRRTFSRPRTLHMRRTRA